MDTNRCHEGYHYSRDAAITLDCYTLRRRRSDSAHRPAVDAQGGHDGAARAFEQTTHQGSNHSIIHFISFHVIRTMPPNSDDRA
jgi:hypothetical protein